MGLLDGLLGGLLGTGGQASQRRALIAIVLSFLQQSGGLQALLRRMQQSGHGAQMQSWIGTGANQQISPDVLSEILGHGRLAEIAEQLGMTREEAAGSLAQALPEVVDSMTPQGRITHDEDDLVARTLEDLQRNKPQT